LSSATLEITTSHLYIMRIYRWYEFMQPCVLFCCDYENVIVMLQ